MSTNASRFYYLRLMAKPTADTDEQQASPSSTLPRTPLRPKFNRWSKDRFAKDTIDEEPGLEVSVVALEP